MSTTAMMYLIFTLMATIATIGPVYKVRRLASTVFYIPLVGWIVSLAYSTGVSTLLLLLFSFKSSIAGLGNLTGSVIFSVWLYWEHRKKQG